MTRRGCRRTRRRGERTTAARHARMHGRKRFACTRCAPAATLSMANDLRAVFRWCRRLPDEALSAPGLSRAPCHTTCRCFFQVFGRSGLPHRADTRARRQEARPRGFLRRDEPAARRSRQPARPHPWAPGSRIAFTAAATRLCTKTPVVSAPATRRRLLRRCATPCCGLSGLCRVPSRHPRSLRRKPPRGHRNRKIRRPSNCPARACGMAHREPRPIRSGTMPRATGTGRSGPSTGKTSPQQ